MSPPEDVLRRDDGAQPSGEEPLRSVKNRIGSLNLLWCEEEQP